MSEAVSNSIESQPSQTSQTNAPHSKAIIFMTVITVILNACLLFAIIDIVAWCFPSLTGGASFGSIFGDVVYAYPIWLALLLFEVLIFRTKAFLIVNSITALLPLLAFLIFMML